MARKKNGKQRRGEDAERRPAFDDLHPETKQTAWGVIVFTIAILAALSYFQLAGRFGNFFYGLFNALLGYGFFLIPVILFIIAGIFIFSRRTDLYFSTMFGAGLFLVSTLALMEVLSDTTKEYGGYVGFLLGYPLISIFGFWGSVAILSAGVLVAVAIAWNLSFQSLWALMTPSAEDEALDDVRVVEAIPDPEDEESEEEEGEKPQSSLREKMLATVQGIARSKEKTKEDNEAVQRIESTHKAVRQRIKWEVPPFSLLERGAGKPEAGDIKVFANIIQKTLSDFGIEVEMGEVSIGPAVTQYTLKPAQGVKLSRITSLQDDLSLALAAHPLRIEAPIPGKSLVGVEIPNRTIALVRIRQLIETDQFSKNPYPLVFPLGIDVGGKIVYADLGKMPHVLIAGSTGSGKSVAIQSFLISLLFHNSPEALKLILIDPKRVELTPYNGIPHLLSDVIIEAKKAVMALRWAAKEMDRRYQVLSEAKVRDIHSYNAAQAKDPQGAIMPYVVVVVDELADLMTTYPREVEAAIVRLAQMSRAVGIHLVISTQRPSVEVITGLIKANVPARVAFSTASQIDSRTILDGAGAEKLLGRGDMLFLSADTPKPVRIQGGYVSEEEVKKVTNYLRELEVVEEAVPEGEPGTRERLDDFLSIAERGGAGGASLNNGLHDEDGDDDEMYEEAKQVIVEAGKASASFLQRRLKIGYARAARILDMLERDGIIGPADGAKPRDVIGGGTMHKPDDEEASL